MTPIEAAMVQVSNLLDKVTTPAVQQSSNAVGNYILINSELLKTIIEQVTELTEAVQQLEEWKNGQLGDGK